MPETHLLALLLRRRLGAGGSRGIPPGRYRVGAGGMSAVITVPAAGAAPDVQADDGGPVDASVRGGMRSLLGVLVGELGMVTAVLTGRISARGKLWRLLALLGAMRP